MVKNFVSRPLLTLGSGAGENKEVESLKPQSEYVLCILSGYLPKTKSIHPSKPSRHRMCRSSVLAVCAGLAASSGQL